MLNIIGFVLLIVITVFVYKTAGDYERNTVGWALTAFAAGVGIQIILPVFIVIIIAVAANFSGSSIQKIQSDMPVATISIVCIILSLVAGFLILQHIAKLPEEKSFDLPPAPPSDFNQNQ